MANPSFLFLWRFVKPSLNAVAILAVGVLWITPGCADRGAAPPTKTSAGSQRTTTTSTPTASVQTAIVARINRRPIYRSDLDKVLGEGNKPSVRAALRGLVERELLLQEADGSGLGAGLPTEAQARADAFLERHFSKRVLCAHFTEREYREMYIVMKPRFVRGELFEVAELHWRCDHKTPDDQGGCRARAHQHANQQWKPILAAVKTAQDLRILQQKESGNPALVYRESTIHRTGAEHSNAPKHITEAIAKLSPGQSTSVNGPDGARLLVLVHKRPPASRQLDDPGVRSEIRDELCPRTVQFHRNKYVHDLMKSAWLEIVVEQLPEISDMPTKTANGTAAVLLRKPADR